MTSLRQHFQNLRKVSSQIFVKVMWSKFHRNRSNSVQIKGAYRQTDRQTHRRTDRRTDRDRPGDNIFSYEMTEYKKGRYKDLPRERRDCFLCMLDLVGDDFFWA